MILFSKYVITVIITNMCLIYNTFKNNYKLEKPSQRFDHKFIPNKSIRYLSLLLYEIVAKR